MSMERCGFCVFIADMMRAAMCLGGRNSRDSSDSFYRELGDQETFKIEDRSSDGSTTTEEYINPEFLRMGPSTSFDVGTVHRCCHNHAPFLSMLKQGKKRLLTQMLFGDVGLLDDLHHGQIQCALDRCHLWRFNAFTLENVSGGRGLAELCAYLFQYYGLYSHFNLDVTKAWKLFTLIENGYHSTNPFHNSVHAIDVTQAMHCFLKQNVIIKHCTPTEIMACLIAAISHDVDHPGVSQPFLVATTNHLAVLYKNTSVLENHHWRSAVSYIIESGMLDGININRIGLVQQICSLILATDITRQDEYLGQFKIHLDTNTLDMSRQEHRHLVLQIALKCADISNPCREWDISKMWSLKVCEEFFRQGDFEREMSSGVTSLCDRYTNTVPKIQTGFFKYVVTPLFTEWHRFLQNNLSAQMLKNLEFNQGRWEQMAAEEATDETRTDISDADMVDDDIDTSSSQNTLENSEMLPPLRRATSTPVCQQPVSTNQWMRYSEPAEVSLLVPDENIPITQTEDNEQDNIPDIQEQVPGPEKETTERSKLLGEHFDINGERYEDPDQLEAHSELLTERSELLGGHFEAFSEVPRILGTNHGHSEPNYEVFELLRRPFASDALLNASGVITRDRDWHLFRLQTFPPFEYAQSLLNEGPRITKAPKVVDIRMTNVNGSFDLKKKHTSNSSFDSDSEAVNAFKTQQGARRRSEPAKESDTTLSNPSHRRKSEPSDTSKMAATEKPRKITSAIPDFLRRLIPRRPRRGSAPVSPTESHGGSTARANGRHRNIQNWFNTLTGRTSTPRRGSLPTEIIRSVSPDL